MAADSAAQGIREIDEEGSIAIISDDVDEPYTRPALSKRLWTDESFDESDDYFDTAEATGARISLRTEATAVDVEAKSVRTSLGDFTYDKLLFVTGGRPKGRTSQGSATLSRVRACPRSFDSAPPCAVGAEYSPSGIPTMPCRPRRVCLDFLAIRRLCPGISPGGV
ncbi:FAD-dependent oxidoreductase [Brevibacterium linens]|nr:FAD/NAD(P)-binding oxidoreductase [Brevibacterium linens]